MQTSYINTDEQLDVLISVREALHQVQRSANDPTCWKWAIIALVSATNGALVCNLSGTTHVGALKKSDRAKMIQAIDASLQSCGLSPGLPDVRLETPMKLLDMAANRHRFDAGAGPLIPISHDQRGAFAWLLELRNTFMHFQPQGWSLYISDLPGAFIQVLRVVKRAALDGHSFRHLSDEEREELLGNCAALERMLIEIEQQQS